MQRLILMRHAKTEAWYEGVDDHGRALVTRGREDAARVADALIDEGWGADLALVSTARRARETWLAMAGQLDVSDVHYLDDLYLASPETISDIISQRGSDRRTLLLIGHNPGIHEFAWELARTAGSGNPEATDRLRQKYPTGCAGLFEAREDAPFVPALFRLVDVIHPKALRCSDDKA